MAKETKVKVLSKSGRIQLALVFPLRLSLPLSSAIPPSLSENSFFLPMLMAANGGGFIQRLCPPYPDTELPLLTCSKGKRHMSLLALGSV